MTAWASCIEPTQSYIRQGVCYFPVISLHWSDWNSAIVCACSHLLDMSRKGFLTCLSTFASSLTGVLFSQKATFCLGFAYAYYLHQMHNNIPALCVISVCTHAAKLTGGICLSKPYNGNLVLLKSNHIVYSFPLFAGQEPSSPAIADRTTESIQDCTYSHP